jgi:hypothetical protein
VVLAVAQENPNTAPCPQASKAQVWTPTEKFNVEVTNDTSDFYRFFDVTPHATFLYSCVQKTIEVDLPYETEFLRRYDQFRAAIDEMFDMSARTVDLLFRFMQQNNGQLSARARSKEFAALTDHEVERVENIYSNFNAT